MELGLLSPERRVLERDRNGKRQLQEKEEKLREWVARATEAFGRCLARRRLRQRYGVVKQSCLTKRPLVIR